MRKYYPIMSEKVRTYKILGIPCTCGHVTLEHNCSIFNIVTECNYCYCPKYEKDNDWYQQMKKEEEQTLQNSERVSRN